MILQNRMPCSKNTKTGRNKSYCGRQRVGILGESPTLTQVKKMKVNAIECQKCKDTIYSRAGHDFRYCSCKEVFIDGGFDYTRIGGEKKMFKEKTIEVKATKKELYDDWNTRADKFGVIK